MKNIEDEEEKKELKVVIKMKEIGILIIIVSGIDYKSIEL